MNIFSSDICHEEILRNRKRSLAFDENVNYGEWREKVKEKLTELLGDMPEKVPLNVRVEWEEQRENFREIRFIFDTEAFASVPCHLLIPNNAKERRPLIICLQGHSTGMHVSLGVRKVFPRDNKEVGFGDRDFAIQAVNEGFYIGGSRDAYSVVKKIFEKALCPDNCRFVTGKEGHRFYADPAWKVFKELSGWN